MLIGGQIGGGIQYQLGTPLDQLIIGHYVMDVKPWIRWGNSPDDTTTSLERMWGLIGIMDKMKCFSKGFVFVLIIVAWVIIISISYCFTNQFFSKKLIQCIEEENYEKLEKMCALPIGNVNALPRFSNLLAAVAELPAADTPLGFACRKNDVEAVKILLKNGANPNHEPRFQLYKAVPLSLAASHGNMEIMQLLLEYGANVSEYGNQVLFTQLKARQDNDDLPLKAIQDSITLFEQYGFDLKSEDSNGETIFLKAARLSDLEVARYLLDEKDTNISETNQNGQTALHLACMSGLVKEPSAEFVLFVLDRGLDPSIKDSIGKTACDYAVENGHTELEALLTP